VPTIHDPIAEFLQQVPVIILDGALATELEQRGANLDDPLWSAKVLLEQPQMIRAVHRDYFEAGADIAITASYQASFQGFARRGLTASQTERLLRTSVLLAAEARDDYLRQSQRQAGSPPPRPSPLIAASVGPYGAALADGSEYRGGYALSDDALMAFHRPRLAVLTEAGADLMACETVPSLREALVLAQLLEEFPHCCAWISFSCRDGTQTWEGQAIEDCARALEAFPQIVSIGINCTRPEFIASLLRRMRAQTTKPLLAYPNSGETYDAATKSWHGPAAAVPLAAHTLEWYGAGARLIGGCCRSRPADIRAIRQELQRCA
jgi:homocysteine S-methyltransferase